MVVLSLGSNHGDRLGAVERAIDWLSELLTEFNASQIYETEPVGHSGTNYMNAVVKGVYDGSVEDLEKLCKEYEIAHGRDPESRKLNLVPVDIDIVIADGVVLRPRDFRCSFFKKGYVAISI